MTIYASSNVTRESYANLDDPICLALIAEVTQPSLGVGYEIGRAIERGKLILCLFRPASGRG